MIMNCQTMKIISLQLKSKLFLKIPSRQGQSLKRIAKVNIF